MYKLLLFTLLFAFLVESQRLCEEFIEQEDCEDETLWHPMTARALTGVGGGEYACFWHPLKQTCEDLSLWGLKSNCPQQPPQQLGNGCFLHATAGECWGDDACYWSEKHCLQKPTLSTTSSPVPVSKCTPLLNAQDCWLEEFCFWNGQTNACEISPDSITQVPCNEHILRADCVGSTYQGAVCAWRDSENKCFEWSFDCEQFEDRFVCEHASFEGQSCIWLQDECDQANPTTKLGKTKAKPFEQAFKSQPLWVALLAGFSIFSILLFSVWRNYKKHSSVTIDEKPILIQDFGERAFDVRLDDLESN